MIKFETFLNIYAKDLELNAKTWVSGVWKEDMEENLIEDGENSREGEVAPALIAIHPREKYAVVAVGPELRVYDIE